MKTFINQNLITQWEITKNQPKGLVFMRRQKNYKEEKKLRKLLF